MVVYNFTDTNNRVFIRRVKYARNYYAKINYTMLSQ